MELREELQVELLEKSQVQLLKKKKNTDRVPGKSQGELQRELQEGN